MQLKTLSTETDALPGLSYTQFKAQLTHEHQSVIHTIRYDQGNPNLKLILSKASEALNPNQANNHIGEGGTLDELAASQPDLRLLVNGTYSHYRKGYYLWHHDSYAVGDPVGLARIREHTYDDTAYNAATGYLQSLTGASWGLIDTPTLSAKYILSSRPLLIWQNVPQAIPENEMVEPGSVNPPSYLGHAHERHARTAVGTDIRGNLAFLILECVAESVGATLPELQAIGLELGLVNLLNMDGGGSSRFWLKTDTGHILTNRVTEEDAERILGHTLMLVG